MSGPGHHHHHQSCGCAAHGGAGTAAAGGYIDGSDAEGDVLYAPIDTGHVVCLNEAVDGSAANVFKPYASRTDKTTFVDSPAEDADLLFKIPFTSAVRLKSICICAGPDGRAPTGAKLFANKEDLAFSSLEDSAPTQELTLPEDTEAAVWHPVKTAKFGSVHHLCIALSGSHAGEGTGVRVYYIGLKGIDTKLRRAVVATVYEAQPNLADRTTAADEKALADAGHL